MADKKTSRNAAASASTTLKDGRSSKSAKTAAGSALSQQPMSKTGKITSRQADRAVANYLLGKRA